MRNDIEAFHEANSFYMKHEQEKNDNSIKFERDRRV